MRTSKIISWLLPVVTLTLLSIASATRAQDGGASLVANPHEPQVVEPPEGGVNWKGVGAGAGAVVGNLVYVPAKLVYGILGGIAGGAGYALTGGNKQVADSIWRSSLGGDYVLTPEMMTGDKPIYFSGPNEAGSTPAAATANTMPRSSGVPGTGGTSLPAPVSAVDSSHATRPIDSGAGPVSTNIGPRYNSPANKKVPLRDTSIE